MSGNDQQLNVTLIDDHTLFRQGLSGILRDCTDIRVIGEHPSISAAAEANSTNGAADVVLVDGKCFSGDIPTTYGLLRTVAPAAKVIVMTTEGSPHLLAFMLRAGVDAYVYKNATSDEIISTIRSVVVRNDHVIISVSRSDSRSLYENEESALSQREREILEMVAKGYSNRGISRRLYITVGTVKRHLTNIYVKLEAKSRTEAVNKALESEILSIDQIVECARRPVLE